MSNDQPAPPLPPINAFQLSTKQGVGYGLTIMLPTAIIFALCCVNIYARAAAHKSTTFYVVIAALCALFLIAQLNVMLFKRESRIEIRGTQILFIGRNNTIRLSQPMSNIVDLRVRLNRSYNEPSFFTVVFANRRHFEFDYDVERRDELIALIEQGSGKRFSV